MKQCWREKLWKGHPLLARCAPTSLRSTLPGANTPRKPVNLQCSLATHDSTEPAIVLSIGTSQRMCIS